MAKMNGTIINKDGKAYWVANNAEDAPVVSENRNQVPQDVKIIPMGKLTKDERNLLREAHSYIHLDNYYKHETFLKNYREFHKVTGGKYIDGGFQKFKVACIQARRMFL